MSLTLKDLREIARDHGLEGGSKMGYAQLMQELFGETMPKRQRKSKVKKQKIESKGKGKEKGKGKGKYHPDSESEPEPAVGDHWRCDTIPTLLRCFRRIETVDNGDCMFDSVRLILEKSGVQATVQQLRAIVADYIRNNYSQGMVYWMNDLVADMSGRLCHQKLPRNVNSRQQMLWLANEYETNRHCWGDVVALRALSIALKIRFMVVTGDPPCGATWHYAIDLVPPTAPIAALLYRGGIHYEALVPKGWSDHGLFQEHEMPKESCLNSMELLITSYA